MNIGVIGLGRIGKIHLTNILSRGDCKVLAVADTDEKNLINVAKFHGIKHYDTEIESVIAHQDIDAVFICTPTVWHFNQVKEALKQGKYVFCEKPLDLDLSRNISLMKDSQDIHKKLMIGFNRRFDKNFSFIQESKMKLGQLISLKIISRDPYPPSLDYVLSSGGLFKDMTIHDFDMARFILGEEIVEVWASGNVCFNKELKNIDIDTALIQMRSESGVLISIENSRKCSIGYDQRLELFGEKGVLQVENPKTNDCIYSNYQGIHHSTIKDFFIDRYDESYKEELDCFLDCIKKNEAFPVSIYDAIKAIELAELAKTSLDESCAMFIH